MSDHPDVETRGELKRLEEFANTLKKGSVVHSKIVPVIAAITRDLATHDSQSKNEVWALKLQVTVGTTVGLRNIALNKTSTLIDIKSLVENQPQALSVDRIKVKRTGRAWTQFDTRTIVDCEIINGDELLIDCTAKAQKQFDKNVTGLARIENCDVKLNAAIDLLVAAIHCFILDLGFTCVMELPSTVPGFAPSLRELPAGTLLPSDWKCADNKFRLLYKHKAKPGKQFVLQAEFDEVNVVGVTLGLKNAVAPAVMTLALSQFVGGSVAAPLGEAPYYEVMSSRFQCVEELNDQVVTLVRKAVPDLPSTTTPPSASSSAAADMDVVSPQGTATYDPPQARPQVVPPLAAAAVPQPRGSGSAHAVPPPAFNAGRGDLDPFPRVVITPQGGVAAPSLMVGPGAGNMVGPDHPMFNGGGVYGDDEYGLGFEGGPATGGGEGGVDPNSYFFPGSAGVDPDGTGLGLPQPRFDPFGPVVGPNSGVNVGNPGGRFGGRGGRGRPAPGEPNPDHMKPPGW